MTSIMLQRDLVNTLKKQTLLNVDILGKLHPMSSDLSRMITDNCLDKTTQNMFYHLAHYLVCIIDPKITLHWPLYDSKTERIYRKELSIIISDYSSKDLLTPIMSSYLVNPGCYKMTLLVFQMSQLAVQRALQMKMNEGSQKKLYSEITEKYKSLDGDSFILHVDSVTEMMTQKFSYYLWKRQATEDVAKKLRDRIIAMESVLSSTNGKGVINKIVDGYIKKHALNDKESVDILKIKNVNSPCAVFDKWLEVVDGQIDAIETKWEANAIKFLKLAETTSKNAETLLARQTGETNKGTFTVEFNPKTDNFSTEELEKQMNSEQKYILKNIIREGRLSFPNLIRGFLISIGFILKNTEVGGEIYTFNEYLKGGHKNYNTIVSDMRVLMEKLMNAEKRLQIQSQEANQYRNLSSIQDLPQIPPLPDLSDLKIDRDYHSQMFDSLTPLNLNKHQFNLLKQKTGSFTRPMPKSNLITPYHIQRDDFFKPITNFPVYDNLNSTQNPNISIISNVTSRGNETLCEHSSGFTKQQLLRLLSTKKSSSSKKFNHKRERPDMKIKKGGMFNESSASSESIAIYRSHSSPNLCENRKIKSHTNLPSRKLSIMKEDSLSLFEVSGIAALERDGSYCMPPGLTLLESTRKLIDASSLPSVSVNASMRSDSGALDLNKEIEIENFKVPQVLPQRRSREAEGNAVQSNIINTSSPTPLVLSPSIIITSSPPKVNVEATEDTKTETPKPNPQLIRKSSSLEKIINRFKKVRAVLPSDIQEHNDMKSILEEKENMNVVNEDIYQATRNLLPDLLSPNYNSMNPKSNDFLEQLYFDSDEDIKPMGRQSLGAALGVDHTILDQFDLFD